VTVMVPQTCECQEAIAAANTHGKKFFVTGGEKSIGGLHELYALKNAPIKMANTSYGCFMAQHKRDVERVYKKMSSKEKVDFKRKMAEMYEAGADEGQSLPPSLTSI
jgi:hypothetical protein